MNTVSWASFVSHVNILLRMLSSSQKQIYQLKGCVYTDSFKLVMENVL